MKKNKTERRIFEAADALTPEPRSFESVTKGVDWGAVAQKDRPSPRRHRALIPVAIVGLVICAAVPIAIALSVYFSNVTIYYGDGGERPILYGEFVASKWNCSDPSIDFSHSALEVAKEKSDTPPNVLLYEEDGNYACSVRFIGSPFASFEFEPLTFKMGGYRGEATYLGKPCPFAIGFPLKELGEKSIIVSFGDSSSFAFGTVYFIQNS